jgi:serine/threonine protein kinase
LPPVAVKVLTDRKEAEIELKIATDICGQNLPGITKLLDNGIVSSF